jgi:hypothetical protein
MTTFCFGVYTQLISSCVYLSCDSDDTIYVAFNQYNLTLWLFQEAYPGTDTERLEKHIFRMYDTNDVSMLCVIDIKKETVPRDVSFFEGFSAVYDYDTALKK